MKICDECASKRGEKGGAERALVAKRNFSAISLSTSTFSPAFVSPFPSLPRLFFLSLEERKGVLFLSATSNFFFYDGLETAFLYICSYTYISPSYIVHLFQLFIKLFSIFI